MPLKPHRGWFSDEVTAPESDAATASENHTPEARMVLRKGWGTVPSSVDPMDSAKSVGEAIPVENSLPDIPESDIPESKVQTAEPVLESEIIEQENSLEETCLDDVEKAEAFELTTELEPEETIPPEDCSEDDFYSRIVDLIEAYKMPFVLGSAVKAILKANKVADRRANLEKAQWYVKRLIKVAETESSDCTPADFSGVVLPNIYDVATDFSLDFFTGSLLRELLDYGVEGSQHSLKTAAQILERLLKDTTVVGSVETD